MGKRLIYSTYKQNFDRLFQKLKEQKKHIGIEEIHIFLFKKDSVWNKQSFTKYEKGILISGSLSTDEFQSFLTNQSTLSICNLEIHDYQIPDFMNTGTAYPYPIEYQNKK